MVQQTTLSRGTVRSRRHVSQISVTRRQRRQTQLWKREATSANMEFFYDLILSASHRLIPATDFGFCCNPPFIHSCVLSSFTNSPRGCKQLTSLPVQLLWLTTLSLTTTFIRLSDKSLSNQKRQPSRPASLSSCDVWRLEVHASVCRCCVTLRHFLTAFYSLM